MRFPFRCFGYH